MTRRRAGGFARRVADAGAARAARGGTGGTRARRRTPSPTSCAASAAQSGILLHGGRLRQPARVRARRPRPGHDRRPARHPAHPRRWTPTAGAALAKVRGRRNVLDACWTLRERFPPTRGSCVSASCTWAVRRRRSGRGGLLRRTFGEREIIITPASPVLATHLGPGRGVWRIRSRTERSATPRSRPSRPSAAGRLHGGARRPMVAEVTAVDLVHRAEIIHVLQEHRRLHDARRATLRPLEDRARFCITRSVCAATSSPPTSSMVAGSSGI
jgi:hypothetical protein